MNGSTKYRVAEQQRNLYYAVDSPSLKTSQTQTPTSKLSINLVQKQPRLPRLAHADPCKEFPRDRQGNVAVSAFLCNFRVIVQRAVAPAAAHQETEGYPESRHGVESEMTRASYGAHCSVLAVDLYQFNP